MSTKRGGPRHGRYVFLPLAAAAGLYVVVGQFLDTRGREFGAIIVMAVMLTGLITFRVREARYQRRVDADAGKTVRTER